MLLAGQVRVAPVSTRCTSTLSSIISLSLSVLRIQTILQFCRIRILHESDLISKIFRFFVILIPFKVDTRFLLKVHIYKTRILLLIARQYWVKHDWMNTSKSLTDNVIQFIIISLRVRLFRNYITWRHLKIIHKHLKNDMRKNKDESSIGAVTMCNRYMVQNDCWRLYYDGYPAGSGSRNFFT